MSISQLSPITSVVLTLSVNSRFANDMCPRSLQNSPIYRNRPKVSISSVAKLGVVTFRLSLALIAETFSAVTLALIMSTPLPVPSSVASTLPFPRSGLDAIGFDGVTADILCGSLKRSQTILLTFLR